jgi:drug/metabolite transporter (DMT)-like permease
MHVSSAADGRQRSAGDRTRLVLALAVVYVAWGGTYPAIRVLVRDVPPLLGTGVRFVLAGALLAAFVGARGGLRAPRREVVNATLVGTVILGDVGVLALAERHVTAGLAALLIASVPLWVALLRVVDGQRPPPVALLAVAVGFGGVAILVLPDDGTQAAPLGWMLVLVGAALVEAIGQFGAQRVALPDPWTNTAIQLVGSGVVLVVLGVAIGELGDVRTDALTWASAGAFAYLLLPGSLLAYGAFVWLLDHARIATVATYAYVNPVVAVAAGWALLGEQVSATMAAAAALILGAVVLVVRERG